MKTPATVRSGVAVVTGASRGVGRGVAEALGMAGMTVYVTGRSTTEGAFRIGDWVDTPWGPRPAEATTWAGVELESRLAVGWSLLVTCRLALTEIADDEPPPLLHFRGRYSSV